MSGCSNSCDVVTGRCGCSAPLSRPARGSPAPFKRLALRSTIGSSSIAPARNVSIYSIGLRALQAIRGPLNSRSGEVPRSHVVVLASNLVMSAEAGASPSWIRTAPVSMSSNDRISGVVTVHYLFGAATQELAIRLEASNDGTAWVDADVYPGWIQIVSATSERLKPMSVPFAFVRIACGLSGTVAGPVFACFDVRCMLDRS